MRTSRILVVDDDPNMQLLLEYNLGRKGHRTETASDGPTAIRKALDERFDLILLDVMLPDHSGLDVCKRLRAEPKIGDTPIILVTAGSHAEDLADAAGAGATDCVTKPFDPIRLIEQIEALLEDPRGSE